MRPRAPTSSSPSTPLETIAEQWEALGKFAAELARQVASLGHGGQRGFIKNVVILENGLRAALLQLAEQIELPKLRRACRKNQAVETSATQAPAVRRPGFRATLPDAIERHLAGRKRFDLSGLSPAGSNGHRPDARARYLKRLEAIGAVLASPQIYARRVKRKLEARAKRPPMKLLPVRHRSALPDLVQVSPHSELGRYVWYNDSG